MRVSIEQLVDALERVGAGVRKEIKDGASVIKLLYSRGGFEMFKKAIFETAGSSGESSCEMNEDEFIRLLRKLTDLSDWEILELFDTWDRHGDGIVSAMDLFLLVSLLVASEARQTSLILYLHNRDLFELLTHSPPMKQPPKSTTTSEKEVGEDVVEREQSPITVIDASTSSEEHPKPLASAALCTSRRSSSNSLIAVHTRNERQKKEVKMTFNQFCELGNAVGLTANYILAILEPYNIGVKDSFTFEDFNAFAFAVFSAFDERREVTSFGAAFPQTSIPELQQSHQLPTVSRLCVIC